jgi:hypothetical protein
MRKDCRSIDGTEHREWHNLYGMYMQRATAEGVAQRGLSPTNKALARPFVLSRAFAPGTQRYVTTHCCYLQHTTVASSAYTRLYVVVHRDVRSGRAVSIVSASHHCVRQCVMCVKQLPVCLCVVVICTST